MPPFVEDIKSNYDPCEPEGFGGGVCGFCCQSLRLTSHSKWRYLRETGLLPWKHDMALVVVGTTIQNMKIAWHCQCHCHGSATIVVALMMMLLMTLLMTHRKARAMRNKQRAGNFASNVSMFTRIFLRNQKRTFYVTECLKKSRQTKQKSVHRFWQ